MTSPQPAPPVGALDRRFTAFTVDRMVGWCLAGIAAGIVWMLLDDRPWIVLGTLAGVLLVHGTALALVLGLTGSSPGRAVTGLRVVDASDGTPIGVGRALLRSAVVALAGLPTFGFGLAALAWTAVEDRGHRRRGWHDHLVGSLVVDVRPATGPAQPSEEDDQPHQIVNLTALRLVPAAQEPVQHLPAPRSAPDPAPTVVRTLPPTRWTVRFDDGQVLEVAGIALVGRRPEPRAGEQVSHLVPLASTDMSISKTHAQFGPSQDGTLLVMDRGSTNGTTLVRHGITRQLQPGRPTALLAGDRVVFGDREMTVVGG